MYKKTLYKKLQVVLLLLGVVFLAQGQFTVVVGPAAGGAYGINELALTSFINSGTSLSTCYATIDCEADATGKVFELRTKNFMLQQGSTALAYQQIISSDVIAASTEYYIFNQTGKLPVGKYTICVSLHQMGNSNVLATGCIQVTTIADGNLLLTTPYDGEVLNAFLPAFGWSMTNFSDDYNVTFNIKICELKDGQSYADAIQYNPPLITEIGFRQTFYNYPAAAPQLKEDSRYVWQVEALVNNVPRYLSEVWMFRFKKARAITPDPKKTVVTQYPFLDRNLNASPYVFKDAIVFRYNNECIDTMLNYALYIAGKKELLRLSDKPVKLRPGINYYKFPLSKELQALAKKSETEGEQVYLLEVSNTRKEKWRMKFVVRNNTKPQK